MAFSVNKVTLLGKLGRDAETTYTNNGKAITRFSLATDRSVKKGDGWESITNWTNVVLFGNEKIAELLKKGTGVFVEGRLEASSYEKDGKKVYKTDVIAESVIVPNIRMNAASSASGGYDGGQDDGNEAPF
jgi:single-strand DNA-binding protein